MRVSKNKVRAESARSGPAACARMAGLTGALRLRGLIAICLIGIFAPVDSAYAIPPFARQTGLECNACHTVYPQLTALGRQFKLNGYTMGQAPFYEKFGAWAQASFTHTAKDQPDDAAPHFGKNDNFALDQVSLFYGGKLFGKIGAFLQGTYDGVGRVFAWDNMDVRFADTASIGGGNLVYGVSLNNSPGVQDVLNSSPVWGFPFDGSALAPAPAAGPLIAEGLGQIAAGATVYAMWNNAFYGEAGAYHTLSHASIDTLTGDSEGTPQSDGPAPYWRFFWQTDWGKSNLALGTFGLYAPLYPDGDKSQGSDAYTDIGVDAQYQYMGQRDSVTARMNFIQEYQDLHASHALGNADNNSNQLSSFNASASYLYDKTLQFTAGGGVVWGDSDAAYYGTTNGSPDSQNVTLQVDYLPLNKTPWKTYPWFNPRLSLQYVHYFEFDGSTHNVDGAGRNAGDNDTVWALLTLTF